MELIIFVQGAVMSIAFIYWLIMILWLLASLFWYWPKEGKPAITFPIVGGYVLIFILFLLLGIQVFGFPIG